MGVLIRKEKEGFVFTGIAKLAIVGFIVSLASAFINTIWAVYLDSFLHSIVYVGLLSSFFTLISFLSFFFIIPIIEKSDKAKIYSISLILYAIAYLLFAINKNLYFLIIIAFILTILATLKITSFGIIVKDKSSKKQLSRNEGLMYTFMNIAWVIGPLFAGYIASKAGVSMVFILASIFIFLAFISFNISKIKDKNIKKKTDTNVVKNFLDFFRNKDRVFAYILSGGVNFWWILIYLFMPLFIIRQGLEKIWIGYFLFAIAVPLILFQYKFAKLAGKTGFRKIFKTGFIIPCIFALLCFFVTNIYIILIFLVLASIGLAMLEATTEAYFLDICRKKDTLRFYGPYNTTMDVNNFIGKILPAVVLIFLPFKFIFLFFSLFMFVFFIISFKVKNIVELKRG